MVPAENNVPQEGNCGVMKLTILCLDIELIFKEALEDLADMVDMVRKGARKNYNIV